MSQECIFISTELQQSVMPTGQPRSQLPRQHFSTVLWPHFTSTLTPCKIPVCANLLNDAMGEVVYSVIHPVPLHQWRTTVSGRRKQLHDWFSLLIPFPTGLGCWDLSMVSAWKHVSYHKPVEIQENFTILQSFPLISQARDRDSEGKQFVDDNC